MNYIADMDLVANRRPSFYRKRHGDVFVVLAEFCELRGPIAIQIFPEDCDDMIRDELNVFIVEVMAIDYSGSHAGIPSFYPSDSYIIYQNKRKTAFVYYFTLHDICARGYSRIFMLSVIEYRNHEIMKNIDVIKGAFESAAKVCHFENISMFFKEIEIKQNNVDKIMKKQLEWWRLQIMKHNTIYNKEIKPPTERRSQCDITAGKSVSKLTTRRRSKSISYIPTDDTYDEYLIQMKKQRDISEMCPIAYLFVRNTLEQLYNSYCTTYRVRKFKSEAVYNNDAPDTRTRANPCLYFADLLIQCPTPHYSPPYTSSGNKEQAFGGNIEDDFYCSVVENSQFYSNIHRDNSPPQGITVYDVGYEPDYLEDASSDYDIVPETIQSFLVPEDPYFVTTSDRINCLTPRSIVRDLNTLKRKLDHRLIVDYIYAALSGVTIVVIGDDPDTSALCNAFSFFISKPDSILLHQTKLDITQLLQYRVVHCKATLDVRKCLKDFLQAQICCVLWFEKRRYEVGRYEGTLVEAIWGPKENLFYDRILYRFVKANLLNQLGYPILIKYYELLHGEELDLEYIVKDYKGNDRDIVKYQLLQLLNIPFHFLHANHTIQYSLK